MASLDPDMPLATVRTMDDHIAKALARPAFLSTLVSSFGGLALVLALVGVYGMMSVVGRRATEDIAIGAWPWARPARACWRWCCDGRCCCRPSGLPPA